MTFRAGQGYRRWAVGVSVAVLVASSLAGTGAATAAATRERAAVIALPVPAHAVGADLTAAHTGSTYLGNAAYPDKTTHPVLWHRTGFARSPSMTSGSRPA